MNQISVLLADDHEMVRQGLAAMLSTCDRIYVQAQVSNGMEAIESLSRTPCDVALLDLTMPRLDGLATCERIWCSLPKTKVIILTDHDEAAYTAQALEAGANGLVAKSESVDELISAVLTVANGGNFISNKIKNLIITQIDQKRPLHKGIDSLSKREFELLCLLSKGMRIRDCAEQMAVGESTASTYRARIMGKLGLQSTGEIIRYAIEHGVTH